MTSELHPLATDYLERLDRAARRLPRDRRRELHGEIEAHIAEAIPAGATDAEALTALERLGEPEEVVEAEAPRAPRHERGAQEWAAIILLLAGGFLMGIGWVAGLVLLWSSRAWRTRERWIGTLVVPGGLATAWLVLAIGALGVGPCEAGSGDCGPSTAESVLFLALLVGSVLGPILTAIFLARRAGDEPSAAPLRPAGG